MTVHYSIKVSRLKMTGSSMSGGTTTFPGLVMGSVSIRQLDFVIAASFNRISKHLIRVSSRPSILQS